MRKPTSVALLALTLAGCQGRGLQPQHTSPAIPQKNDTIPTTTSLPPATEPQPSTTETTTPEIIPETVPVTRPRATVPATTAATTSTAPRSEVESGGTLACIRRYEQGEDGYTTNTGNGYYGAYQFDLPTWRSVGGTGLPSDAEPWEQDMRAEMLRSLRGLAPWPTPAIMCT